MTGTGAADDQPEEGGDPVVSPPTPPAAGGAYGPPGYPDSPGYPSAQGYPGYPSAQGYPGSPGNPSPQGYAGYPGYALPSHPSAMTALVLGIVSLTSVVVLCGLALPAAPFAWALGRKAVREIDASPGRYSGRGTAQAGMMMGIVGTVLLVLALAGVVLLVIGLATTESTVTFSDPASAIGALP